MLNRIKTQHIHYKEKCIRNFRTTPDQASHKNYYPAGNFNSRAEVSEIRLPWWQARLQITRSPGYKFTASSRQQTEIYWTNQSDKSLCVTDVCHRPQIPQIRSVQRFLCSVFLCEWFNQYLHVKVLMCPPSTHIYISQLSRFIVYSIRLLQCLSRI